MTSIHQQLMYPYIYTETKDLRCIGLLIKHHLFGILLYVFIFIRYNVVLSSLQHNSYPLLQNILQYDIKLRRQPNLQELQDKGLILKLGENTTKES